MENISLTARFALQDRKKYMAKFLRADQYVNLSNWGKAMVTHFLKNSLFLRIPENVATEIAGPHFKGPVTIAVYRQPQDLVIVLADKYGFVSHSIYNYTAKQLEKMVANICYKMLPATAWANDYESPNQDHIMSALNAVQNSGNPSYLAGV